MGKNCLADEQMVILLEVKFSTVLFLTQHALGVVERSGVYDLRKIERWFLHWFRNQFYM